MSTNDINAWFDDFDYRLTNVVPEVIAETAVEYFRDNFQEEQWNGTAWADLNPKYLRRKKGYKKLAGSPPKLQATIRPAIVEHGFVRVTAGNYKVPYAGVHNYGFMGRVTVDAHINKNFMGTGREVKIKTHQRMMNIPKRQYMGKSLEMNDRIKTRIINVIK